jgi:cell division protein FtsQ
VPRPPAIADACGRAVRRALPALVATAAITGIGSGIWLGYHFVTSSSRFAISTIEVHGAAQLSPDQVRAALPVELGQNLFTTELDEVASALRAHPWIDTASVHRVLPDTLVVEVREHVPAAVAQLGELYLVDAAGHPFKRAQLEAGEGAGLPVITGLDRASFRRDPDAAAETIVDSLATLAAWRAVATRPAVGELHIGAHRSITLRTYDHGAAIQLGPLGHDLAARMQTFDAAWAELTDTERDRVRTLHLDARPDHVTVAFVKD